MKRSSSKELLHRAFVLSVFMNGIIGILDLVAASFFYFSPLIQKIIFPYTATTIGKELYMLTNLATTYGQRIGAFYFLSHGIVKVFLVWGLITKRIWAYPTAMVLLGIFSLYQILSLVAHYSTFVLILLIANIVVIGLIAHEYVSVKKILSAMHLS